MIMRRLLLSGWHLRPKVGRKYLTSDTDLEYCVDLVKKHDYDSYLAGLLVAQDMRQLYFSIRAYNVEIASVKDQVRGNNMAGKIRFQWWRDFLESSCLDGRSNCPDHPVARALVKTNLGHNLSKSWLDRSLQARHRDFLVGNYETLDDLETYCEHAHSSILYLLMDGTNLTGDELFQLTSHLGVCYGLVTFLRSIPVHFSQGHFNCFPNDLMEKHKYDPSDIQKSIDSLGEITFEIASQANGHLERGLELLRVPIFSNKRIFYSIVRGPVIRSKIQLSVLREANFNPWKTVGPEYQQLQYQLRLFGSKILNRL